MSSLFARLGFPDNLPKPLYWACLFYLGHLVCQGWVASSEIFVLATCAVVLWAVYRRQIRLSFHILYYPLFVYALMSTISALAADREQHAFGESALWTKMLIFPAVITLFREIPRSRVMALWGHITFAVYVSAYGLFQFFILHRRDLEHRITGTTAHVMTFSGLLLPLSLLLLVMFLHERKLWQLGATTAVTLALLLTFTRSVWLGWIVAVFVLLLLQRSRWMFYALPVLVFFLTFMPLSLFGRLVSTFNTKQESNLDRIRMVEAGVEIIKDSPLLGVGPANVKEVYPLYRKHDAPRFRIPHLHNNVVQIWAERGIIALCAYFLLLFLFLRECVRAWKGPRRMWAEIGIVATVGLTYAGLFEFNFGDTEVFFLLLDLFALVVCSLEIGTPDDAPARMLPSPALAVPA